MAKSSNTRTTKAASRTGAPKNAKTAVEDEVREYDEFEDRPTRSHRRVFESYEDSSARIRERLSDRTDDVLDRADEFMDRGERFVDESQSIARALTVGYLKQIQLLGEVAQKFAGSVLDGTIKDEPRKKPASRKGVGNGSANGARANGDRLYRWDELSDIVGDVTDGLFDAFDEAVDIPRRALDDAYDSYDRSRSRERRPRD